jgi:exosortase/archaeosortase family protein
LNAALSPKNRGQARFMITFLTLAGAGLALYFFPYEQVGLSSDSWFKAYFAAYARAAGWVLHVFDPSVAVAGSTINGRFGMRIVRSCDAMEANILFVSAVLAFPAPAARKAAAAVLGLAALVACNVLRLCCLYYVGVYAPAEFEYAHYDAWPLLMVAFATLDFLACARWMSGAAEPLAVAADVAA